MSITLKAYNLLNKKYDVKVWIENDEGDIISDRYGNYSNKEIKWASGSYWAYSFIEGTGNKSEDMMIRIRDEYDNFSGDATIKALIQESDSEKDIDSFEDNIEILENNESNLGNSVTDYEDSSEINNTITSTSPNSDGVIVLGKKKETKTATTEKNTDSIIYKSKNEYIKEYIPYAFGIVCIIIITFLVFDKTNEVKRRKE